MFAPSLGKLHTTDITLRHLVCLIILVIVNIKISHQHDKLTVKTEPFHIDLYHKFNSEAEFVPRGSILVRPKTDYRPAQASIISQSKLTESDLSSLRGGQEIVKNQEDGLYFLRAVQRRRKSESKEGQERVAETLVKSCSLYSSNLNDFLTINLNSFNEFISVNIYSSDPECNNSPPTDLSSKFNTTVLIDISPLGPQPDTATYIKRIEEERQSKLKEGKEDNRSFLAKYWMYIVPGVIILMMLGGPEQGSR